METELKCPYTGATIEIMPVGKGPLGEVTGWIGRVVSPIGGYTTRVFQIKAQLIDFLRHRKGKLKGEPLYPRIEIREPSLVGDVEGQERQIERDQDEMALSGADRIVKSVVDGKGPNPR